MILTYIYHSGYAIENELFTIIIDYYQDSDPNPNKGIVYKHLLHRDKPLYVLSTHSHHDHFNPEILTWKEIKKDIIYIFSKDILDEHKAAIGDAIYLDKLESYEDSLLSVKAFGSTDIGGSFLIKTANKTLFHAGDLNNWHWNEESSEAEIAEAEKWFREELNLLDKEVDYLDLAMFPIDPRLGKDYMKGAEEFISTIRTKIFAPMHFDKAYNKAAAFAEFANQKSCKSICWQHKGESITI